MRYFPATFVLLSCFSLAACSRPTPTQVWLDSSWEAGEVKACETYPDMQYFLNCDSSAVARKSGECSARMGMEQAAEAIKNRQKFDAQAAVAEQNKVCQREARMDALATSKTLFGRFSEKNPWAAESPEAAKEEERSLEKSLASVPAGPAKELMLRMMQDNPLRLWYCVKKDNAVIVCMRSRN